MRAPRFVRGWLRGWGGGGLLLFMVYGAPVTHKVLSARAVRTALRLASASGRTSECSGLH